MKPLAYTYYIYGLTLHSEVPLCLPEQGCGELADVELREAPASFFTEANERVPLNQCAGSWYQIGRLADGAHYLRWEGVGEFLISGDGCRMFCRQFDIATSESFQVYMLGQALSYALVGQGFEPIHGTSVVNEGEAIVFVGDSGFGKSTLAAAFIAGGLQMLTDDLLILQEKHGHVFAYPGPPRIKLFPKTARRFFGKAVSGATMNRNTAKLILPLSKECHCSSPVPVNIVFPLTKPRDVFRKQPVRLRLQSPREAFIELLKNTFNYRVADASRLQRQLAETTRLVRLLRMLKISIPRDFDALPSVQEAILRELKRGPRPGQTEVLACAD